MKFLDTNNVCIKQRRAKLLLDLYELLHQTRGSSGIATLAQWSEIRGHDNKAACLRDLYRRKDELLPFSVVLDFGTEEAFAIDLKGRGIRALVTREVGEATTFLEERRKKQEGPDALSHDDDTNASGSCLNCGNALRLPLEELVSLRSTPTFMSMNEMRKTYKVSHARLKRILKAKKLERKPGRQAVETVRSKDDVAKAINLALAKTSYKVKVIEIATLLVVSKRTASRFIQRVRGGRLSSMGGAI